MPPTAPTPTHASAPAHEHDGLRFDFNGLVSQPYVLRHYLFDIYHGEALIIGGHLPYGRYISVPPNVTAVILRSDGKHISLASGIHSLRSELKGAAPVSAQFVNMEHQPVTYLIKTKGYGQLSLEVGLRVLMEVQAPELVTHWKEPLADVEGLIKQALVTVSANNSYEDCLRKLPELLNAGVKAQVDAGCRARGLAVTDMVVISVEADKQYTEQERENKLATDQMIAEIKKFAKELEVAQKEAEFKEEHSQHEHDQKMRDFKHREDEEERRREVELLAVQVDEDINALRQPARRREVAVTVGTMVRTLNHEVRLKAIATVGEMIKALLDERQKYPGHFQTDSENETLAKALQFLQDLSKPYDSPKIPQQMRSYLAVDEDQPEPPLAAKPMKPDGTIATPAPGPNGSPTS